MGKRGTGYLCIGHCALIEGMIITTRTLVTGGLCGDHVERR